VQGLVVARVALPGPPLLCPLLVHWRLEVLASLSEVQLLVAVAAVAVQPGQGSCLGLGPLGQDRMHHSSSPPASNTHTPPPLVLQCITAPSTAMLLRRTPVGAATCAS
jgi:hypothetical protein